MNVLYAASEAYPYICMGGTSDAAGALPRALCALGCDTRLILPLYRCLAKQYRDKLQFLCNVSVPVSYMQFSCGLYKLTEESGLTVYFIENSDYFDRDCIYGDEDDPNRFAFFSKAVVTLLDAIAPLEAWYPDVMHCTDWQTALIPIYLRELQYAHPERKPIYTVFTIHNAEHPAVRNYFSLNDEFGLSGVLFAEGTMELNGEVDLMKGAIVCCDAITTFSPRYAQELIADDNILTLSAVLRENQNKLFGILNGVDMTRHDPQSSAFLPQNYSAENLGGKAACKAALQEKLGLTVSPAAPLFACVSRLQPRKGYPLLDQILPELMRQGAQLVILGSGHKEMEQMLSASNGKYPGQYVCTVSGYDEVLSAQIYAASDIYLAPSVSEPCGIPVMCAMRYGTVPIARATGGLRDTVIEAGSPGENGFLFEAYEPDAFLSAIARATTAFRDTNAWQALMRQCMNQNFGWTAAAKAYLALYHKISD
ncbi:MAG: glycogen/starch synthase [Oscillospiraceae bacterium]|nr:glycogen/starch synthase [Oscillospiraceae bacterium]